MTRKPSVFMALLIGVLQGVSAYAFQHTGARQGVHYSFYAPDWVWQKASPNSAMGADVNVLGIFRNRGENEIGVRVSLQIPGDSPAVFVKDPDSLQRSFSVAPEETVRIAFSGISILRDEPPGDFEFGLETVIEGVPDPVPFHVKAVRGAAVGDSVTAKLLPALIALGWCLVLWFALRPYMRPGTWREPYAPDLESEGKE